MPGIVLGLLCVPQLVKVTSMRKRDREAETWRCLTVAVPMEPEVIQKECAWLHPAWVELTFPMLFPFRAFFRGSNVMISPLAGEDQQVFTIFVGHLLRYNFQPCEQQSGLQVGWRSQSKCF